MGIRFLCDACGKRIHVKDFLAGKRGICPKCGAGVDIPLESRLPAGRTRQARAPTSEPKADEASSSLRLLPVGRIVGVSDFPRTDVLAEAANSPWFIRTAEFAPPRLLDGNELRTLLDTGTIGPAAEVRRDDWPNWVPARELQSWGTATSALTAGTGRAQPGNAAPIRSAPMLGTGVPARLLPPQVMPTAEGSDFSPSTTPLYYPRRTTVRRALLVATLLLLVLAVGVIGMWLIVNGFRIAKVLEPPSPRVVARRQVPDLIPRIEEMFRCDG